MRTHTFEIDYTYCPKGHGDWIFIPSSTLCYDLFWCIKCNTFYVPTVKPKSADAIDKEFTEGRARELIEYAAFLAWRKKLQPKDMPKSPSHSTY